MGSIQTSIQLYDGASGVLQKITNAVSRTTQRFDDMNDHFDDAFDESGFRSAKNGFNTINILINKIENNIDRSTNTQQTFTQQVNKSTAAEGEMLSKLNKVEATINRTGEGFKGWQKSIIVANQALSLIQNTLGKLGIMDMSGAFGRIDTMNRFQKTVTVMTDDSNMASAALNHLKETTLGTAYGLDVAGKSAQGFLTRGMSLGTATNQVRIWADAVSFYGEGTNQQLESVVDALGKMYSKGKVEADQLDRLFDAGIGAAEIYANAVGKSVSVVKDELSKGAISSAKFIDTVSQALDAGISAGAAKEAGNTWATTFSNMRAAITRGWTSVITNLDNALSKQGLPSSMEMVTMFGKKVENVLNTVGDAMENIITLAVRVYEVMSTVGNFIANNWSIISPIIYGVIAALATYAIYLGIVKGIELATAAVSAAMAVGKGIFAAATMIATGATWAQTTAQMGLNSAMYACPLVWIIILIIALIAVFYAVIAVINHFAGTSVSATGIIMGVFAIAGAFVGNLFMALLELVFGVIEYWYNWFAAIANFIGNIFNDPIGAVINLFADLADNVLGVLEKIASAMDFIFGSNMANTVKGWRADLKVFAETAVEEYGNGTYEDRVPELDINGVLDDLGLSLKRFNYGDAWDAAEKKRGKGADDKFANMFKGDDTGFEYDNSLDNAYNDLSDTADNTSKIADSVHISDEDLKYLHDIAERDTINRYTTAEIKVEMTNHNTVNGNRDIDGIVDYLRDVVEEQMSVSAEGVG